MIREYIIKISDEIMDEEIADRPKELIRCKNCKWYIKKFENEGRCIKHDNNYHKPDWYCADGEKR
jgi:hypothetical protein